MQRYLIHDHILHSAFSIHKMTDDEGTCVCVCAHVCSGM